MRDSEEFRRKSLEYNKDGKIGLKLLNRLDNQDDLSMAYTPGVAEACKEIVKDREGLYKYTIKHNTIAVVTDGTAVLGLGDIGAEASIPVMEGKAVLFKKFAGVDAWSVPLNNMRLNGNEGKTDVDKIVKAVVALAPQYGGINLEDIAAPACFEVETRLKKELDIPVFHDDQHGTAIVALAALNNYLYITKKEVTEIKVVISGAGSAGISVARLFRRAGVKNILMIDSRGVLHSKREDLNEWKKEFMVDTESREIGDALVKADVFIGVSVPKVVNNEMIKTMNVNPGIFALSNPVPEIWPEEIKEIRDDAIIATGRSDYPNQVNNVLIFPFIFRGALDVRAKDINEEMKMAGAKALAEVAREEVPQIILDSYNLDSLKFGKDYIIPKPMDRRVFERVSVAVAKAAMDSGVARKRIDLDLYSKELREGKYL